MLVRPYTDGDHAALSKLYLASRVQTFYWLDTSAYKAEDFDRDTLGEKVLVAEEEGEIMGFISLWVPDNFIHHLYVDPGCVNQGVGKLLLQAACAGFDLPLKLKCLEKNINACNFYLSQGWRILYKQADAGGDYYLMESK